VLRALCDLRVEKDDARAIMDLSFKSEKEQLKVLSNGSVADKADLLEPVRCAPASTSACPMHACCQAYLAGDVCFVPVSARPDKTAVPPLLIERARHDWMPHDFCLRLPRWHAL
jgi:hypothetical protein